MTNMTISGEPKGDSLYGYVPHGGGPKDLRRCVGEDLTFLAMGTLLVRVLRNYDWQFASHWFPLKWWYFHPEPMFGVKMMNFKRRQEQAH